MGRQRIGKSYASRPIDIDILFYEHLVNNEPDLVIPHPRLHLRKFSLIPLNEIAGSFIHPVLQKTIETLLKECEDTLKVVKYL
jgi:2-amino-4-hydroxy-6-hydroxymethyldihydropteridine diphosphokinase